MPRYIRTNLGILIPERPLGVPGAPESTFHPVVLMVDSKDLLGKDCELEWIERAVQEYTFEEVVQFVCMVSATIQADLGLEFGKAQRTAIDSTFGANRGLELLKRAQRVGEETGNGVLIFHERQLLGLLKVGARVCAATSGARPKSFQGLGEACLGLNGLLDVGAFPEGEGQVEKAALYTFANVLFNHRGNLIHAFARTHEVLNDTPEGWKGPEKPIRRALEKATGMPPERLLSLLWVLNAPFFTLRPEDVSAGKWLIGEDYLKGARDLPAEEVRRLTGLVVTDLADYRQALLGEAEAGTAGWYDTLATRRHPIVRMSGRLVCPFPQQFMWAISGELEKRILDKAATTEADRREYMRVRGQLLDAYLSRILRRLYGDRFVEEKQLLPLAKGASVCDGIVDYGDTLIVLEGKALTLKHSARIGESAEAYEEFCRKAYHKPHRQFNSTLTLLRAGRLESLMLQNERIKTIVPVIVTFGVPPNPITLLLERKKLSDHELYKDPRVRPFQVMIEDEVELLEVLGRTRKTWKDLLVDKAASEIARDVSFTNYVAANHPGFERSHSPHLSAIYDIVADEMIAYWRALGLQQDEGDAA